MLTLRERIGLYTTDGRKGYAIADGIFTDIIVSLRRDPRFRGVPIFDLELLLADARGDAEHRLIGELKDRVHVELVNAALAALE